MVPGPMTPGKIRPMFRYWHIGTVLPVAVEEYRLDVQARRYVNACTRFRQEQ